MAMAKKTVWEEKQKKKKTKLVQVKSRKRNVSEMWGGGMPRPQGQV